MLRRFLLLAIALLGCDPKPASIEFAGPLPKIIFSGQPAQLPQVVIKDGAGHELQQPVPFTLTILPEGRVEVVGDRLSPLANGHFEVIASINNSPMTARVGSTVRIIERSEIECTPSCEVDVGDRITTRAYWVSGGEQFGSPCTFEHSGAAFRQLENGVFEAISPGSTRISCGNARTELIANHRIDELTLACPKEFHEPTEGGGAMACVVPAQTKMKLVVDAKGKGQPVPSPKVKWSTIDPRVVTISNGELITNGKGETEVIATARGASAKLIVQVSPPVKLTCEKRRYYHRIVFQFGARRTGALYCEFESSEACVKENLRRIDAADLRKNVHRILEACCCAASR